MEAIENLRSKIVKDIFESKHSEPYEISESFEKEKKLNQDCSCKICKMIHESEKQWLKFQPRNEIEKYLIELVSKVENDICKK